ncbi:MAG: histidine phosphatase family protein [Bacilli bacterium]|nr:histidine phosphatase family protein [Bacilli bacterium]
MTKILFIRHAFTPANNIRFNKQLGIYKIAKDKNMPIDLIYGVKQAEELNKFINTLSGNVLCLVSPYRRTNETMNIALKNVNFSYEIKTLDELSELNAGFHYAVNNSELLSVHPEAKEVLENLKIDPYNTKYLNGESQIDVKNRTKNISSELTLLSNSNKYDYIIIFGHGVANNWIIYWLTGNLNKIYQNNCDVLSYEKGKVELIFHPKTIVPDGYKVDIEKHINHVNNSNIKY